MDHVLTLIAGAAARVEPSHTLAVRAALEALGADTASARWLSPERACDIDFDLLAPEQAEAAASRALGGLAVDVVAQPLAGRRRRLLVADMDSTVIRGESLDELADLAGLRERIAPITARAMKGELEFAAALRERVAMLKGADAALLDAVLARLEPMPGARRLVATMRAHGARTVLVSGGFVQVARRVADMCGFDGYHANAPALAGGRFTGEMAEPVLDSAGKLAALTAEAARHQIPLQAAIAVGDGANDLDMLRAAGLGVAFRAKPVVAAAARARIDHADLTALLYLQGYADADIRG